MSEQEGIWETEQWREMRIIMERDGRIISIGEWIRLAPHSRIETHCSYLDKRDVVETREVIKLTRKLGTYQGTGAG